MLNMEIRNHFNNRKRINVRKGILPGNSKSLWDAVKIANDKNINILPNILFKDSMEVDHSKLPDEFADYFDTKIKTLLIQLS